MSGQGRGWGGGNPEPPEPPPPREPEECWLIVEWMPPLKRWHTWPRFYGSERAANQRIVAMRKGSYVGPRLIEAVKMVEAKP